MKYVYLYLLLGVAAFCFITSLPPRPEPKGTTVNIDVVMEGDQISSVIVNDREYVANPDDPNGSWILKPLPAESE